MQGKRSDQKARRLQEDCGLYLFYRIGWGRPACVLAVHLTQYLTTKNARFKIRGEGKHRYPLPHTMFNFIHICSHKAVKSTTKEKKKRSNKVFYNCIYFLIENAMFKTIATNSYSLVCHTKYLFKSKIWDSPLLSERACLNALPKEPGASRVCV